MFSIAADVARKRLRIRLGGMMSVAEVEEFSRQQQAELLRAGFRAGAFDLLIETEGNVVQTQDTMAAFARLLALSPVKSRRIAVVRSSMMTRMQSRRIGKDREGYRVFDTMIEAEDWLAASDPVVSVGAIAADRH